MVATPKLNKASETEPWVPKWSADSVNRRDRSSQPRNSLDTSILYHESDTLTAGALRKFGRNFVRTVWC
jgi:hypothetical protein